MSETMARKLPARLTKAAGDFAVIVIGVLVALTVDSWAESVRERRLEVGYLRRLADDVRANQTELNRMVGGWSVLEASAEEILDYLDGPMESEASADELVVASVLASFVTLPNLVTPTYDELIGSSSLNLIRSPEIRQALVRYVSGMTFGDPFLTRLQARQDYEAFVGQNVPARLRRAIGRECWSLDEGPRIACAPQFGQFDVTSYLRSLRAAADLRGALNWRLADAIRAREIFEIRLETGRTLLEIIEGGVSDR